MSTENQVEHKITSRRKNTKLWQRGLYIILFILLGISSLYQFWQITDLQQDLIQQKIKMMRVQQLEAKKAENTTSSLTKLSQQVESIEKTTQIFSAAYQNFNKNALQHLLLDIEQAVTMASEMLYLTNDTLSARKLLQNIDNKLQNENQPELAKLHLALQKDIQALADLPAINRAAEITRIDNLVQQVDQLSLNIDERRAIINVQPTTNVSLAWWQQLRHTIWAELKSLVQIRRLDKPEQALLPIEQIHLLRENIKLRLLSARIALMTHNQTMYYQDLQQVKRLMTKYFDQRDSHVQQAMSVPTQLMSIPLSHEKPVFVTTKVLRQVHNHVLTKAGE